MLDQVLRVFDLSPQVDLDILEAGQSLTSITVKTLQGVGPVLAGSSFDAVLVQGDTTATFAGALAAFYARVPVVHLEAGLRTGDTASPFPEEMNRRLTSQLTHVHLAPTSAAADALIYEGFDSARIYITGNTVIDALYDVLATAPELPPLLRDVSRDRKIVLVTLHRRESWGDPLRTIAKALGAVAARHSDVLMYCPMHRNPTVRDVLADELGACPNVFLDEPLDYPAFAAVMAACHVIVTDSGGVQEEAPALGKPVLVVRDTTERREAIESGAARLLGTDGDALERALEQLLAPGSSLYASMRV